MSPHKDDAALTARACQGDQEAYGDLYERYLDAIYRYLFYRVGNRHDAEDLTEQVFLKAWEAIDGSRQEIHFRPWIYRIAHNTVVDFYRTRKEEVPLTEEPVLPSNNPGIEERLLAQERAAQLAQAISRLSPPHQHVLILRFIAGLSTHEVAHILDRSVGAVRVLQHRALKAARAFLMAEEITHE